LFLSRQHTENTVLSVSIFREQVFCRLQQRARGIADGSTSSELSFDRLLRVEKPEAFIFETYRFILKREPLPSEVEGYVERLRKGTSRQVILSKFAFSEEAHALGTRCPVYWTEKRIKELIDLPRTDFVPTAYRSFLWREPDPTEQQHYLRLLDRGIPRAYLIHEIAVSPEAKRLSPKLPASWSPSSVEELLALPEADFLTRSCRTYLWRDPDTNELNSFTESLRKGAPRIWILFQLCTAATATGVAGQFPHDWLPKTIDELQGVSETDFLPAAYRTYLWRDPDPTGLTHYSTLLERGTPRVLILHNIACSDEARTLRTEFPREWIPRSIDQLLTVCDEEFLEAAYRSLLWRKPDPVGLQTWGSMLTGGIPRIFVLYKIASSEEARKAGTTFPEDWTPKNAKDLLRLPPGELLNAAYRSILWRAPDRRARRYAVDLKWGRSPVSVLREIASSEEALRIPFRIADLDSLPDSRPRLRWLLRKWIHSFLNRAFNSILGLDHRFESLEEVAYQALSEVKGSISNLERQFRSEIMLSRDLVEREFENLRAVSSQRGDHDFLAKMGGVEDSIQRLQSAVTTLTSQLQEKEFRLSEQIDASIAVIASKVDENEASIAAIASKVDENEASIAAIASKVDENEASIAAIASNVDENKVLISSKLDDYAVTNSTELTDRTTLLSRKLDAYSSTLATTIQSSGRTLAVPLADSLLLTKVKDFYYFIPAEDAQLAACLVIGGHLEPGLAEFLEKWVHRGMTVVDVGANIGLHSLSFARLVGPDGRVYCFDPSPRMVKILGMNLVMNQLQARSVIQQVAVTDGPGTAAFYLNEICGHSSLYGNGANADAINVRTGSLDMLLPFDTKVDFVKVDAEGAEPLIVRGMSQIIARNPEIAILLEFAPSLLERANYSPSRFLDELRALGFEMMRVDDATGQLHPINVDTLMTTASSNLLLYKRGKVA
jgi:FkbM family methyltransferase